MLYFKCFFANMLKEVIIYYNFSDVKQFLIKPQFENVHTFYWNKIYLSQSKLIHVDKYIIHYITRVQSILLRKHDVQITNWMTDLLLKYYPTGLESCILINRYLFISDRSLTVLSVYGIKTEKEKGKWTRV